MKKLFVQVEFVDIAILAGVAYRVNRCDLAHWSKLSDKKKIAAQTLRYSLENVALAMGFHRESGTLTESDIAEAIDSRSIEVNRKYRGGEKPA